MAVRLYLMPMIGTGTRQDPFTGKYVNDLEVIRSGCIRYSRVDSAICLIEAPANYLNSVGASSYDYRDAGCFNWQRHPQC